MQWQTNDWQVNRFLWEVNNKMTPTVSREVPPVSRKSQRPDIPSYLSTGSSQVEPGRPGKYYGEEDPATKDQKEKTGRIAGLSGVPGMQAGRDIVIKNLTINNAGSGTGSSGPYEPLAYPQY
jgi:hypothetical protein